MKASAIRAIAAPSVAAARTTASSPIGLKWS